MVESVHHVHSAVVNAAGGLIAASGNPDLRTWWRSAAKPFQAMPLVQGGAADEYGLSTEEIALACASHSSEPRHVEVVTGFMAKVDVSEDQLACGLHTPLSPVVARELIRGSAVMTPKWSNCSGKHTGMLAAAKHQGWPVAGYNAAGHPLQNRILEDVAAWTGVPPEDLAQSVDGCTAVCFGLPVRAMAVSYARLGASREDAPRRIVGAMLAHPFLVAGTGRLCTDLSQAWPGHIVAKIGADGIYCATIPALGLGIALKVEDGDMRASGVALLEILRQVLERVAPDVWRTFPREALAGHARQDLLSTRGQPTGELRPSGSLQFFDA